MEHFGASKYLVVQRRPFGRVRILRVTEDHGNTVRAYELPRFIRMYPCASGLDVRRMLQIFEDDAERLGGRRVRKSLIMPQGRIRSLLVGLPRYKEYEERVSALSLGNEWRKSEARLYNVAIFIGSKLPVWLRTPYARMCACVGVAAYLKAWPVQRFDVGWLE